MYLKWKIYLSLFKISQIIFFLKHKNTGDILFTFHIIFFKFEHLPLMISLHLVKKKKENCVSSVDIVLVLSSM